MSENGDGIHDVADRTSALAASTLSKAERLDLIEKCLETNAESRKNMLLLRDYIEVGIERFKKPPIDLKTHLELCVVRMSRYARSDEEHEAIGALRKLIQQPDQQHRLEKAYKCLLGCKIPHDIRLSILQRQLCSRLASRAAASWS
jgi:hypothetical protein